MRALFDRRVFFGFALGVIVTAAALAVVRDADAGKQLQRKSFHSALDAVLERYVEPVDASEVMARGLKHMVGGLDPYSHYLTATERKAVQSKLRSGATVGLNVALRKRGRVKLLEVLAVEPGSSAHAAGLSPGDFVHEIAGTSISDLLSLAEAEILMTGADGDMLELVVQRQADPGPKTMQLMLTRGTGAPLVGGELVQHRGKKLAHVRIRAFRTGTGEAVKRELAELRRAAGDEGVAGIILDVRGNPGGDVSEAVIVADMFVTEGVLTRTRGRGGRILREERAHRAGTDAKTPLVVLQDRHSASASELLAVALQDHGRAKVVGERSYGKGTVQDVIGMEDGSVLTLTIARYFSPRDVMIDARGVQPDLARTLDGVPEPVVVDAAASAL